MAGCKYSFPTKQDVLNDMADAYHTLSNYLEGEGFDEELPPIQDQLGVYINKIRTELDDPGA